jgi:predicted RNA-binding protein
MENTTVIRVSKSYKEKMMKECLAMYLKGHKDRSDKVTVDEMYRELVTFYIEAVDARKALEELFYSEGKKK